MQRTVPSILCLALLLIAPQLCFAQTPGQSDTGAIRVTMTVNPDGSRTVYKFDDAQHNATATTTDESGKVRQTIRYALDEAGHFASGSIFGADGKLRFKSRYQYDNAGRLQEEVQMDANDALLHKIVYNYNEAGKATGYSVFDANGKLINRVGAPMAAANASVAPRKKPGQR